MPQTTIIPIQCETIDQSVIKKEIRSILRAVFTEIDPEKAVHQAIQRHQDEICIQSSQFTIKAQQKIHIFGLGKAAQTMAVGAKKALTGVHFNGAVITKHSNANRAEYLLPEIQTFEGDHPVPTIRSQNAVKASLRALGTMQPEDVVICLISGGGSSLAILPKEGIGVEDYQKVTKLLLESGAAIQEINVIRQGLDQFKGGGLVKLLSPASIVTLILSDVVGDPLDIIASGPTVAPVRNAMTAGQILEKYDLVEKIPSGALKCLLEEKIPEEIPRSGCIGKAKRTVENIMIRNNTSAVQAVFAAAEQQGFKPRIMDTRLLGEASDIGWKLGSFLREETIRRGDVHDTLCWIYGGETTVTIHGRGKGGRNQELALSAARAIAGLPNVAILSIATDGEDGPTDAAGAFVTGDTVARGEQADLDAEVYLKNNNAYPYLDCVGSLIKTGPSGTNVNDLVILFAF